MSQTSTGGDRVGNRETAEGCLVACDGTTPLCLGVKPGAPRRPRTGRKGDPWAASVAARPQSQSDVVPQHSTGDKKARLPRGGRAFRKNGSYFEEDTKLAWAAPFLSFFCLIQLMVERRRSPTFSIGCAASALRIASNFL